MMRRKHSIPAAGLLTCLCLLLLHLAPVAHGDSIDPVFSNPWFVTNAPTGTIGLFAPTGTVAYGGHVPGPTDIPSNSAFRLMASSFGQPLPGQLPDAYIGSILVPADTNFSGAIPVIDSSSTNSAFMDSFGRVIATYQGNVTVYWVKNGVTNTQTYLIAGSPAKRPSRIFWTQEPYRSPVVDLSTVYARIHWTPSVPKPPDTTATNGTPGIWIDPQHSLRAVGCQGLVVIEFFKTGEMLEQVGYELVEVLPPKINQQTVGIGKRLLPMSSTYGEAGLIAEVTKGLPDMAYKHGVQNSPQEGWVYAIAKTVDAPYRLEVYWKQQGAQDIIWPYEVDWYAADWPADAQLYVRSGIAGDTNCPVLIPESLSPELQPFQEPVGHASLSELNAFVTTSTGYSLLKYRADDGVWFEAVRSVTRTDAAVQDQFRHEWPVGSELVPDDGTANKALRLSALPSQRVEVPAFTKGPSVTLECRIKLDAAAMASTNYHNIIGDGEAWSDRCWMFYLTPDKKLKAHLHTTANWYSVVSSNLMEAGRWYHIAQVNDHSISNLAILVDGKIVASIQYTGSPTNNDNPFYIGADRREVGPYGLIDDVRLWHRALSQAEIQSNLASGTLASRTNLVAEYDFQQTATNIVQDKTGGGHDGTASLLAWYTTADFAQHGTAPAFPGYIYEPLGNVYNADLYDYPPPEDPTQVSYVYGVNTGRLEVWWAEPTALAGNLPDPVYWPSRVATYSLIWPENPPQLVIAGQGTDTTGELPPDFYGDPLVYNQPDPGLAGFNPNEEHALILGGKVYALRDDLNTEGFSAPYVLVQYTDNYADRPDMKAFQVVRTNAVYDFAYGPYDAGKLIQAPAPLSLLPRAARSYPGNPDAAWRDRNMDFWAAAAGTDGISNLTMNLYYWYPLQSGFHQPASWGSLPEATCVPWLAQEGAVTSGTPIQVSYTIGWPSNCPTLNLVETLVDPKRGLPAIDGQKSVEVVYQQSQINSSVDSVVLLDPTVSRGVELASIPAGMRSQLSTDGAWYFPELPPHLRERLYFDPARAASERLRFKGEYVEPTSGDGYLLLNKIDGDPADTNSDRYAVLHLPGADAAWSNAVALLATNLVVIADNTTPFDSLALSAGVGKGVGFVTLAFNNSTNLAAPSDPISLSIIRIVTNLYAGQLRVIESGNPLDEKVTLRYGADFAGEPENYVFEWRYSPPSNEGTVPATPYDSWILDRLDEGVLYNTIQGPGVKTLSDNWYVCRYQPLASLNSPAGTNWSAWTSPQLVEGWIKRALSGINPFEQRISDLSNGRINTMVSMISQAGSRWEGDVPLNLDNIDDYGLIEIYETILNRGRDLSIDAIPPINYGPANDALLLAAGRINDLYMLLGNEAMADARDPTIGFGTDDGTYGSEAGSLFCFMNQVDSLLEEELALLRGRDNRYGDFTVRVTPYYNRLTWNFTRGIDGGEVAYALNYNIRDDQGNVDGFITEDDAAVLYPQGHGDAWGHYLTALKGYYRLLASSNFTWIPRVESVTVAGQPVTVDYRDERKFAASAASLAQTGVDIVNRTRRLHHSEDRDQLWAQLSDSNTNRAWGASDWACRAGQGAIFNWAVANTLLPYEDPDPDHEGIQKIDRTTVPELGEIAGSFRSLQTAEDGINAGLNPLGLAAGAVSFDIDPALVDRTAQDPKTHFEQCYDRALVSLNNAVSVMDHAQQCTQLLRKQADSLNDFTATVGEQEIDFQNRLIEIYGYPYSDDIGPGKIYPEGYKGPDLYHFQYVDLPAISGVSQPTSNVYAVNLPAMTYDPQNPGTLQNAGLSILRTALDKVPWVGNLLNAAFAYTDMIFGLDLLYDSGELSTNQVLSVSFALDQTGFIVKPSTYTGTRRAPGELQAAYGNVISAYYRAERAAQEYQALQADMLSLYTYMDATTSANASQNASILMEIGSRQLSFKLAEWLKEIDRKANTWTSFAVDWKKGVVESLPKSVGTATDIMAPTRGALIMGDAVANVVKREGLAWVASKLVTSEDSLKYVSDIKLQAGLARSEDSVEKARLVYEMERLVHQQVVKQIEVQEAIEELAQASGRCQAILAEAMRLVESRVRFRQRAADHVQTARYQDMAYRIFRNDALQKYEASFDLAARYVYLAAKAYDYETCLLDGDTTGTTGSRFIEDIVRTRSIGRVNGGEPQLAGSNGDGGLADVMARMKANWLVLEGRLGFNNPDTETSRFSLRNEAFRTASGTISDETWRNMLWSCKKDNLYDEPEFNRYCIPFNDSTNKEPGLVIPFTSEITFGRNFFGWPLAGGDHAYDSSHFATKIRSVGLWFSNYNAVAVSGLSATPRVYLVPAGEDRMRSPTDNGGEPRTWTVVDQAMPVPFGISTADLDAYDWIPVHDTLSDSLAKIRQYPSLRAYHDSGEFNEDECQSSARLIGRSVWNTRWLLIIPAGTLHNDRAEALRLFIDGAAGTNGVKDIKMFFQTYSYAGN